MTIAVRTEGLIKRYDGSSAVAGVELEIEPGEIHGLVGPNGAGKTTTLRMLATVLAPTAGDAEIGRHRCRQEPDAVRRVIGYMPDTFGVYDDMRVWEYLDFFARCYGLPATRRRQMIGDLLELVDLADKRDALRPGAQPRHAAAAVPGARPGPRPAGAAARRAGVRPRPARPRRAARAAARAARAGQDDRDQQPHPARARGAVHQRRDHRPRPGARLGPRRGHRRSPPAGRRAQASASWATRRPSGGRGVLPRPTAVVAGVERFDDGWLEIALRGDDDSAAPCCCREPSAPAIAWSSFSRRRAISRSSSCRSPAREASDAAAAGGRGRPMIARRHTRNPLRAVRRTPSPASGSGIIAVGIKELRGRMRGRRAFAVLTIYLVCWRSSRGRDLRVLSADASR